MQGLGKERAIKNYLVWASSVRLGNACGKKQSQKGRE